MQKLLKMKNYKSYRTVMPRLLISLFMAITIYAYPQITIDNNDMPSPGDTVRRSTALNVEIYDFELTGEDYTWDFSELTSINQTVDAFVSVTQTPLFYWPFFPGLLPCGRSWQKGSWSGRRNCWNSAFFPSCSVSVSPLSPPSSWLISAVFRY